MFRIPNRFSSTAKKRKYWKGIAFIAEIFVAMGLIGLAAFAGRAKIESNHNERVAQVRDSEQVVSDHFLELSRYCMNFQFSIAPLEKTSPSFEPCNTLRKFTGIYKRELDWSEAISRFEQAAKNPKSPPEFSKLITKVVASIKQMEFTRNNEHLGTWESEFVRISTSPYLILICLIAATIGVSLKCARGCREFFDEFAPPNEVKFPDEEPSNKGNNNSASTYSNGVPISVSYQGYLIWQTETKKWVHVSYCARTKA